MTWFSAIQSSNCTLNCLHGYTNLVWSLCKLKYEFNDISAFNFHTIKARIIASITRKTRLTPINNFSPIAQSIPSVLAINWINLVLVPKSHVICIKPKSIVVYIKAVYIIVSMNTIISALNLPLHRLLI